VWPLFLEPSAIGHTCYLVAYDQKLMAVRSYKVERISGVRVTDQRFDPPLGFSIADHLANAWAIWASETPVDVELRFAPDVAKRVRETQWHPSQTLRQLPDGGLVLRLRIGSTTEIKNWVLGWGAACEVLAPAEFRHEVKADLDAMARVYGTEQAPLAALRELVAQTTSATGLAARRQARREKAAG
jgi:predicted DNA-binding transcriptional regulator YafY